MHFYEESRSRVEAEHARAADAADTAGVSRGSGPPVLLPPRRTHIWMPCMRAASWHERVGAGVAGVHDQHRILARDAGGPQPTGMVLAGL